MTHRQRVRSPSGSNQATYTVLPLPASSSSDASSSRFRNNSPSHASSQDRSSSVVRAVALQATDCLRVTSQAALQVPSRCSRSLSVDGYPPSRSGTPGRSRCARGPRRSHLSADPCHGSVQSRHRRTRPGHTVRRVTPGRFRRRLRGRGTVHAGSRCRYAHTECRLDDGASRFAPSHCRHAVIRRGCCTLPGYRDHRYTKRTRRSRRPPVRTRRTLPSDVVYQSRR